MIKRFISWLNSANARALVITPVNIAIALILLIAIVVNFSGSPLPTWAVGLFVISLAILLCLSGAMVIVKKEIPETPIRGSYAVVFGIIWVIMWGGIGLSFVWAVITNR
jgi:hypothetical protein